MPPERGLWGKAGGHAFPGARQESFLDPLPSLLLAPSPNPAVLPLHMSLCGHLITAGAEPWYRHGRVAMVTVALAMGLSVIAVEAERRLRSQSWGRGVRAQHQDSQLKAPLAA